MKCNCGEDLDIESIVTKHGYDIEILSCVKCEKVVNVNF